MCTYPNKGHKKYVDPREKGLDKRNNILEIHQLSEIDLSDGDNKWMGHMGTVCGGHGAVCVA